MSAVDNAAFGRRILGAALQTTAVMIGVLLLAAAFAANQSWWDRHFLPLFFFSHEKYVLGERLVRLASAVAGIALIVFVRPAIGRLANRMSGDELVAGLLRLILAVGLALAASELIMGRDFTFAAAESQPGEEPMRQPDQKLGWVFKPAHDGSGIAGGRRIAYAIDPRGYRVRSQGASVDVNVPSILFTGESIIAGYGLNWDETIPARAGAALNVQSVSIAVFGYANDQAYLRLESELPRFRQPLAVISLFIPSLFARNLGDDRPHLGSDLTWMPAVHRLWLSALFRFLVPYHSEAAIEQGIAATQAELLATAALARRHGAISLVVDPQFGGETPVEQTLRKRILEQPGIEFVQVRLDSSWHLQGDLHPDPRAAHAIAMAIAAKLRSDFASQHAGITRRAASAGG